MTVAMRILGETVPGTMTAVVARPGGGVSTLLARLCAAASRSTRTVLASWERSPAASAKLVGHRPVELPDVMSWDGSSGLAISELDAPEGTVVAIDYLQLLAPAIDAAATPARLRAIASDRRWRVIVGAMAPRSLVATTGHLAPARAIQLARAGMGDLLQSVDRLVMLTGAGIGRRHATLGTPSPDGDDTWLVRWTAEPTRAETSD